MSEFSTWLLGLAKKFITALWDFFTDILIAIFDLVLTAFLGLLQALPLPSFMQAGGMQSLINVIPPEVWYFASHFRLAECFAMFGAAVVFRMSRKAVTLFQW